MDAAATLAGFLEAGFSNGFAPTAVTHSAGALVWARAIKLLSERRKDLIHRGVDVGRWWNVLMRLSGTFFPEPATRSGWMRECWV